MGGVAMNATIEREPKTETGSNDRVGQAVAAAASDAERDLDAFIERRRQAITAKHEEIRQQTFAAMFPLFVALADAIGRIISAIHAARRDSSTTDPKETRAARTHDEH